MAENKRLILPGFLSHDVCKELEFIHKSCSTVGYRPHVFSTTLAHLIATNSAYLIMPFIPIRERLKEIIEDFFGCQYELSVEFTGLISWSKGAKIGWHSDNNRPYLKQRHYAAVCYLNNYGEDFKGGLFHFQEGEPNTIVPKIGDAILYTADECNVHCVDEGTEAVRGLSFVSRSSNLSSGSEAGIPTTWQAESLSQMKDLKLLLLQGTSFDGDFSQLSKNLLWLRWWDFPYQCIPPNLPMGRLVVLGLRRGRVVNLWDEDGCSQLPLNLRELNLTECNQLQRVPEDIGHMKVLQRIVFKRCSLLTTLPEEFSDLHFLEHLDLTRCRSLRSLPNSFGGLKHLRHLDLSFCSKLKRLPDSFSQLLLIKYLTFEKCKILNIGPNILGKSSSLEHLDFRGCDNIQALPCNISSQRHLKWLYIHCRGLKQLPEDLGELVGLKNLILECPQITQIPDSLGNLIHLEYIDFRSSRLRHFPESVGQLKFLKHLIIRCHKLSYLPDAIGQLNNLQRLFLMGCKALQYLPPSFENLTQLENLDIYDAPKLRIHSGILDGLRSLESLSLYRCKSLDEGCIISLCQKAQALRQLRLRKIEVENCLRIPEHGCSNLEILEVYACKNLVRAEICSTTLTEVELKACHQLTTISGFSADMRLTKLCLRDCQELSEVTNLGDLHCLKTFEISGCLKLFSIEGLHLLKELDVLDISVTHEALQRQNEWLQKLPSPLVLRMSADSIF